MTLNEFLITELESFNNQDRSIIVKNINNFTLGKLSEGAYFVDEDWGNNIYYFPSPNNEYFLVFGQTKENDYFDDDFKDILNTFKFTE